MRRCRAVRRSLGAVGIARSGKPTQPPKGSQRKFYQSHRQNREQICPPDRTVGRLSCSIVATPLSGLWQRRQAVGQKRARETLALQPDIRDRLDFEEGATGEGTHRVETIGPASVSIDHSAARAVPAASSDRISGLLRLCGSAMTPAERYHPLDDFVGRLPLGSLAESVVQLGHQTCREQPYRQTAGRQDELGRLLEFLGREHRVAKRPRPIRQGHGWPAKRRHAPRALASTNGLTSPEPGCV